MYHALCFVLSFYSILTLLAILSKNKLSIFSLSFILFGTCIILFILLSQLNFKKKYISLTPKLNTKLYFWITFLLFISYGFIYRFPLLDSSWYSQGELNQSITKKIFCGLILWYPLLCFIEKKRFISSALISLGFSLLTANRAYPFVFFICAICSYKKAFNRIICVFLASVCLLFVSYKKTSDKENNNPIKELSLRIFDVEFEGMQYIIQNSSQFKNVLYDEVRRYFFRDNSLLLNQKTAAFQRNIDPDLYTRDLGAPTVNLISPIFILSKSMPLAILLYLLFFFFAIYFLKKAKTKSSQLILSIVLLYVLRNGVIFPVLIGSALEFSLPFLLYRKTFKK